MTAPSGSREHRPSTFGTSAWSHPGSSCCESNPMSTSGSISSPNGKHECLAYSGRSEHQHVGLLTGEDRARDGERVGLDDEVLGHRLNVAETALQLTVRVEGSATTGAVGAFDDCRTTCRRPHRPGAHTCPL